MVATEPTAAIGHNNLGHSYLKQGRLEEAEREILTSLRLSPEWDQAHTNLAALLARQDRMKEAGQARARLGYLLLAHAATSGPPSTSWSRRCASTRTTSGRGATSPRPGSASDAVAFV